MAYTTNQAISALNQYLGIDDSRKEIIPETKNRGIVLTLESGEKIVVFVYPLVHKQDNTKNYFDTRDSGAYERSVAWKYALANKLKYFCLGINDSVDKYVDYAFSLECNESTIEKISGTKDGMRNGPGNQIIIPNDYVPQRSFERIANRLGIYISAIKKERLWSYLETYDNRPYMAQQEPEPDIQDDVVEDEYTRAAKIINDHVTEAGFEIPVSKDEIEAAREEFISRFNYKTLSGLSDDVLLSRVFYTLGDNTEALCCWIEMNKECKDFFGSISGGSAYKFGLFQKRETGAWTTGSPQKSQELSEEEAVKRGREIVDALVRGAEIIESADPQTLEDYEKLDDDLKNGVGEQFYNWAWFHKYYSILFPGIISNYHSADWQCHVLRSLGIRPSAKYYARSGQISMVQRRANYLYREFGYVFYDKFGGIKNFVRIGTSDDKKNYAAEWKQRSVVGLGWKLIGSLENYTAGEGVDRNAIAAQLQEHYYPNDAKTASRKAGEISRFYRTDDSTIFVAMSGQTLIALVDGIGAYFYDGNADMSHMKPGQWHQNFTDGETLPVKTEGKLTSCYPITDEDNLLFLYNKYYYGSEMQAEAHTDEIDDEVADETISEDEEIAEERNKRLFRYWMSLQVKPESDSDAGQPYSKTSIDQYVSNIANTPLHGEPSKNVFFTVQIGQVQATIEYLENTERKNNTQSSAIRKYAQFLIAMKEGNMPLNYNTSLESIHECNRIVFGAPGTGKSFALKRDTEEFLKGTSGTMERVTFHPDYTYSQFVGTYKPVSEEGTIKYEFVPGPFMRVFVDAIKSGMSEDPQPHVLVIEEINRAKVAAVFGDVFQLLDRDDNGVSEYDIQTSEDIRKYLAKELGGKPSYYSRIRIPNNMFIWATMNSADQGVFPMDTAFKRRWNFEYLGINQNESEIRGKVMLGTDIIQDVHWNALRRAINEKLAKEYKVNEDKLMGPFFLAKKVIKTVSETDDTIADTDKFIETFKSKVIMYLYEDAAKQHKHKLFSGCEDTTKYSAVCDSFERIGIQIFGEDFEEIYYKPQEEAQEG